MRGRRPTSSTSPSASMSEATATSPDRAAAEPRGDLAIDVRGLVVRRGPREVLHGLDLQVPTGQVVGLLGPSGGGSPP